MSTIATPARQDPTSQFWSGRMLMRTGLSIIALLALNLSWPRLAEVWTTGTFFDTDDAMRMVEVRDWLAGQGWFDLTAHRLDPPRGVFMHWSRVVDVPIGALVRLFGLFTSGATTERLARIAFPLGLQALMIVTTAWVGRVAAGARAALPAALLLVLTGMSFGQFQPGRIDHHAPQILLLMAMTGTTLLSMEARRPRVAAWTGLLSAISLAISLENMPFIAVLTLAPPLAWTLAGVVYRRTLLWQAAGLGVAAPLLFAATVSPARYGLALADAFSVAHLVAILIGAAGLAALGLGGERWCESMMPKSRHGLSDDVMLDPTGLWRRCAALLVLGAMVLVTMVSAFPGALHDPYYDMDPLVLRTWLPHVTEAQSVFVAVAERPFTLTLVIGPILAGALAACWAAWREVGLARVRWIVILALLGMGGIGMAWGIRVATSVQPLAILGGAYAVARATDVSMRRQGLGWAMLPFLVVLPFASMAWAVVPAGDMPPAARAELEGGAACREADALRPLAMLRPGLAFAPIDAGPHLLASTSLSVVAAPYRSRSGNRTVIEGFMANPTTAADIVRGSRAEYVVICPGAVQIQVITRDAPQGLAGQLLAGKIPPWLRPMPMPGTPYKVYGVE